MELLVGAVEGDDDQAAVDAFDLAEAESFMGDDGAGVDLGGIDRCLGLDGGGRRGGLGRDVGRAVGIADGGTGGLDDLHLAVAAGALLPGGRAVCLIPGSWACLIPGGGAACLRPGSLAACLSAKLRSGRLDNRRPAGCVVLVRPGCAFFALRLLRLVLVLFVGTDVRENGPVRDVVRLWRFGGHGRRQLARHGVVIGAGYDRTVEAHVLAGVLVDAGIDQAGVLIALELPHGLVHQALVEDVQ